MLAGKMQNHGFEEFISILLASVVMDVNAFPDFSGKARQHIRC